MNLLFKVIASAFAFVALATCEQTQRQVVPSRKPYNLTVLSLVSMTGNGPKEGKTCMAAQNFVLDQINVRSDILQDYHVTADFADEGPGSNYVPKAAIYYARRMEAMWNELPNQPKAYQTPIVLGMSYTPGCKTFGTFVHHLNSVLIASGCLGSLYTRNRKTFPNLYRTKMSAEFSNHALAAFIKSNGWTKLGLYANADNQYNTMIANHFYDVAAKSGIQLAWFDVASGINQDIVQSMKQSGARIFVFQIAELPVMLQFLCLVYNNGIRGPKYVFIFGGVASSDPSLLPEMVGENCTRSMVIDMFRNILMVGTATVPFENNGNTTLLQYDLASFETSFAKYAGWTKPPIDAEDKVGCYDRMLQAVLVLDKAEKRLSKSNMTLRDYYRDPAAVMKAVNESVADSDFVSLRVGRIKYTSRAEIEDEPSYVSRRKPGNPLEINFRVIRRPNSTVDDIAAYSLQKAVSLNWFTANGLLPRDGALFVQREARLPTPVSILLLALAAIGAVSKSVFGIIRTRPPYSKLSTQKEVIDIATKVLFLFGCVILDGAAVSFALDLSEYGSVLCLVRPFLEAIGLAIINAIFFVKVALFYRTLRKSSRRVRFVPRHASHTKRASTVRRSLSSSTMTCDSLNKQGPLLVLTVRDEFCVLIGAFGFTLVNVLILIVLVLTDQPKSKEIPLEQITYYDEGIDALSVGSVHVCYSRTQSYFFGALAAVHACMLIVASFFAFRLRTANFVQATNKLYCIGIVNTTTLLAAGVCILFIVENVLNAQEVVISVTTLIISSSATAIVLWPSKTASPPRSSLQVFK